MSLVYGAITPHPPILIPQIGKENTAQLDMTRKAMDKIAIGLLESEAETLILISPHGAIQNDAFCMNLSPDFECNFEEFGDFSTKKSWQGNIGLVHKLKEALETKAPLQLMSDRILDHGSSVPLLILTENIPNIKIIPLYYSGLSNEAHFRFGALLKKEIVKRREKVAIIASGDLSHRLEKKSPGGFSSKAKKFDAKLIKYLKGKKNQDILDLDHDLILEAGECGLKSIVTLLGIFESINYEPKLLSYEHPFGVGYLSMQFNI